MCMAMHIKHDVAYSHGQSLSTKGPPMTLGLIHYNAPGNTFEAFLDYAAQTGYEAVELSIDIAMHDDVDDPLKEAEKIRKKVEQRGLVVCALGAGNDFVLLDNDHIKSQVERMKQICKVAQALGTNIIRTEGGIEKDQVPHDKHCQAIAECLKRCVDFIERDQVCLGIDNHGTVTNDANLQLRLFEMVNSKHVGATLDTMNYHWMGHSVATCNNFYDMVAPHVVHTHLKDGRGSRQHYVGESLGEGVIDLHHALQALKKAEYTGAFCAEWEGRGDNRQGYTKCLQWMKANIHQNHD